MAEQALDVLVVGAGPTGRTLGIELLRHGLSCRVVEQELPEPTTFSKAAVVHARTMEVFDDMGVAGAILERARVVRGMNAFAGGRRVAHVDLAGIDSPFPHPYGIPQRETELVLGAHFASLAPRRAALRRRRLDGRGLQEPRAHRGAAARAAGRLDRRPRRLAVRHEAAGAALGRLPRARR
jgi:hypothetical protein